jgi:hypothetical protein
MLRRLVQACRDVSPMRELFKQNNTVSLTHGSVPCALRVRRSTGGEHLSADEQCRTTEHSRVSLGQDVRFSTIHQSIKFCQPSLSSAEATHVCPGIRPHSRREVRRTEHNNISGGFSTEVLRTFYELMNQGSISSSVWHSSSNIESSSGC